MKKVYLKDRKPNKSDKQIFVGFKGGYPDEKGARYFNEHSEKFWDNNVEWWIDEEETNAENLDVHDY